MFTYSMERIRGMKRAFVVGEMEGEGEVIIIEDISQGSGEIGESGEGEEVGRLGLGEKGERGQHGHDYGHGHGHSLDMANRGLCAGGSSYNNTTSTSQRGLGAGDSSYTTTSSSISAEEQARGLCVGDSSYIDVTSKRGLSAGESSYYNTTRGLGAGDSSHNFIKQNTILPSAQPETYKDKQISKKNKQKQAEKSLEGYVDFVRVAGGYVSFLPLYQSEIDERRLMEVVIG